MRAGLLTREWPPDIYGGAGVHVDFLARELKRLIDVDVHCFGEDREGARGHVAAPRMTGSNQALQTLSTDLSMVAEVDHVDLVHSHTWYANMASRQREPDAGRPGLREGNERERSGTGGGGLRLVHRGGEDGRDLRRSAELICEF